MLRLLLIPVALVLLLVGAMVWSGGSTPERADLSFINRGDIITLDPNQMSYVQDFRISYAIREGLYVYDPYTLAPTPTGSVGVDVTPDKLEWVFHLRPEARWTNGDPVTARDYVFAWRRMLETPGEYTYLFYYIKNAQKYEAASARGDAMRFDEVGVKAVDDLTLKVTLENPCGFFLDLLAFVPFYPLNERSMEPFKQEDPRTKKASYSGAFTRPPNVVTNGPFELKAWDFKRRLWMEKSPTYWGRDLVKLDTIEMVVNENRLSQVLMYESGRVDWVADTGSDISAELRAQGRKDLVVTPGFGTNFLTVNTARRVPGLIDNNPLSDVRVRQAFAMGIDKQQICDNITRMGERPATTYIPPGIFRGYTTTPALPYDVERARALLAEAGYPGGRGFPTIPLLFSTASPVTRDMMQNIKNQLKANLNVNVELQSLEQREYKQRVTQKEYVIGPANWIGDYGDPSTFTDKYLSTSLNNDSNWVSPEFDALCAEAAKEPDNARRMQLLQKAEQIINTDLPVIPMYYLVNTDLCRPYVKLKFNPRMTVSFRTLQVTREKE
jgi:oligopeptide transport system substrate-binding protein